MRAKANLTGCSTLIALRRAVVEVPRESCQHAMMTPSLLTITRSRVMWMGHSAPTAACNDLTSSSMSAFVAATGCYRADQCLMFWLTCQLQSCGLHCIFCNSAHLKQLGNDLNRHTLNDEDEQPIDSASRKWSYGSNSGCGESEHCECTEDFGRQIHVKTQMEEM
jgi:hypothetical protein